MANYEPLLAIERGISYVQFLSFCHSGLTSGIASLTLAFFDVSSVLPPPLHRPPASFRPPFPGSILYALRGVWSERRQALSSYQHHCRRSLAARVVATIPARYRVSSSPRAAASHLFMSSPPSTPPSSPPSMYC